MDTHNMNATEVLQKHIDRIPKITIVASMDDKNQIQLDISHPTDLATLCLVAKCIDRHVNQVIQNLMEGKHS